MTHLKVDRKKLLKVIKQDGECLCKENVQCPCGEVLLLLSGKKEQCTCELFTAV